MSRTRNGLILILCAAACGLIGAGLLAAQEAGHPFPHDVHQGLFPSCRACHAGIPSDDTANYYSVSEQNCTPCHDGTNVDEVEWTTPVSHATNLNFEHAAHVDDNDCEDCHRSSPDDPRMIVARAAPETCFACHEDETTPHLAAEVDCWGCHVALTQATALPMATIAAFPKPDGHENEDFVWTHGQLAQEDNPNCAVCHTQESCESCHMNASQLTVVTALGTDARMAELMSDRAGRWPTPDNHQDLTWRVQHGSMAASDPASCGNCHSQQSCEGCHGDEAVSWMPALPVSHSDGPQGALIEEKAPPQHVPGFEFTHGDMVGSRGTDCMACHIPDDCSSCHEGAVDSGHHDDNFFMRHAAEAYAQDTTCVNCHSTEVFCRDCHAGVGLSPADTKTNAYHDTQPGWLLSHATAARQGMEACASCHQQTDCLRCHSAKSGWGVNPHGPDFDPERLTERGTLMCALCHYGDPTMR